VNYKNILVVGRTGAGKSSLINYLAGQKVAEVGVGRPVTSVDDLNSYCCDFMGVPIRLFDSWGIEVDKTEDWKRRTLKILKDNGDFSDDDAAWFHTVVYCISAVNGRVEPIDQTMIRYFQQESFSVVVALTNADRTADEDMKKVEAGLGRETVVTQISSGGRTRYGVSEQFGKEKLLLAIVQSAMRNLPRRTEKRLRADVESWRMGMIDRLRYKDVSRISNGDIERWIKAEAESHAEKIGKAFKDFVADEVRSVVVWNQNVAQSMPGCDVHVTAAVESELSGWDCVGMIACAPLLVLVGIGFLIFGSVEEQRKKLREKINDAAYQMNKYIEGAVREFELKLSQK